MHGDVVSVGASSHRMAHRNPNLGNVASPKSLYGKECRALFIAPEGKVIVGCDLAGIQLRALAHYVNDKELISQILEGDIHTHLAKVYGLITEDSTPEEIKKARSRGKTITYAILMGAGAKKIGNLAGGDDALGRAIMKRLESGIKGWKKFKNHIEMRARIGYFTAIDGRRVSLTNAHLGMSHYLQSFEQAIMKYALYLFNKKLTKAGIDYKQLVVVHDEVEVECNPEDAEFVGKTIQESYKESGEFFKVKLPLDGEYKIGNNWLEVH